MHRKLIFIGSVVLLLAACENGAGGIPNLSSTIETIPPTPATNGDIPSQSASLQKLTYKIGPFSLPAKTEAGAMRDAPGTIQFQAEEPVWVTGFESKIEDAQGHELPQSLLNLAILTNGSEQNPLCTEKQVANPFIGATSTVKKIALPNGDGYPILPEDKIEAKVILQNPTAQDFNNVFFSFTITAIPMRAAKNFSDVSALLLDIDACDHSPLTLPPKEFIKKMAVFALPEGGFLTRAYGLLQDYGVEVSLSANGQPTPFWIAMAEQSEDHKIINLPPFEDPAGISLDAGDKLSLGVAYENPDDKWQGNATGAAMIYIRRGEGGGGGTKDEGRRTKMITASTVQGLILRSEHPPIL